MIFNATVNIPEFHNTFIAVAHYFIGIYGGPGNRNLQLFVFKCILYMETLLSSIAIEHFILVISQKKKQNALLTK